jgi:hypothetical protein
MSGEKSYREGYRDGLRYALMLARSMGLSEDYIKKLEREYSSGEDGTKLKFVYGETYIIYEKSNLKGLEIVREVAAQGHPVLIISRDSRSDLGNMRNVKTALLTYEEKKGGFNPNQLSQLQEFVVNNLEERVVLYIDCVDYMFSTSPSPQNVIRFLTVLKDKVMGKSGIMLLSINKDAVGKAELSVVEKEFKNTLNVK